MSRQPTVDRRSALKTLGGAVTAGLVGSAGTASAATVDLDCYIYANNPPNLVVGSTEIRDLLTDAHAGMDNFLTDVEQSGHCDMTHSVVDRWDTQSSYPSLAEDSITDFQSWLRGQGHTEGNANGECAVHLLVRYQNEDANDPNEAGGLGSGQWPWPQDKGQNPSLVGSGNAIPCAVTHAEGPGAWNRITVQHEVGHTMVDASLQEIQNITHGSVTECNDPDQDDLGDDDGDDDCEDPDGKCETIHHREHTLGTVVSTPSGQGKTVMAHRSPTAAECDANGAGSGVGGDAAHGTGIAPGETSHAADKAFGYTKCVHGPGTNCTLD